MEKEEMGHCLMYGEIEGEPMRKWQGPLENERWEAEHERACAWFYAEAIPYFEDAEAIPYRVHKKRWTLDTVEGQLRVDLVHWRGSGQWNYRAVFEDGDTFANFDTLREAQVILERVARDYEVAS